MEQLSEAKTTIGRLSLRTVVRVRVLFGFYSAISARASMRVLARLYCCCLAYILTTTILTIVIKKSIPIQTLLPIIVEYNINVLISLLTGEKHFFNFCKVIEKVDREMGFAHLPLITPLAQNMFVFICVVRLSYFILFWIKFLNMNTDWLFAMSTFMKISLSLNNMINVISLDLLRQRLILLRRALKYILNRHDLSRTHVTNQIQAIINSLVLYKTLIDSLNTGFSWKKLQIVASFASAFASFIIHGHRTIWSMRVNLNNVVFNNVGTVFEILCVCLFACLPPICIELVLREVDNLKVVIGNRVIDCDDVELSRELEMTREYLELRPFRVSILRVLVLDGSFVLTFAGLCTTCLIVVIQKTGLV